MTNLEKTSKLQDALIFIEFGISILLSSTLIPFFCVHSHPGPGDLPGLSSPKKSTSHSQSPLGSTGRSHLSTDEDDDGSRSPQKKRVGGLSVQPLQQVTETPQRNPLRNALAFVSNSANDIIQNIWNLCLRRGGNGKGPGGGKDFKSL